MVFQFWKESSTSVCGVMVTVVLSKLRTFTVVSENSSTVPFSPALGTVIQSPLWSMLLLVRRTPATRPMMVSLKMSISTAEVAPRPARRLSGLRSMAMATMQTPEMKMTTIFSTPQNEWRYWWRADCASVLSCVSDFTTESSTCVVATAM